MKKFVLAAFAVLAMAGVTTPLPSAAEDGAAPLTATSDSLSGAAETGSQKGTSYPFSTEQEKNIDHDVEAKGVYRDKGGAAGRLGSESAGGLRGGVDLSIKR